MDSKQAGLVSGAYHALIVGDVVISIGSDVYSEGACLSGFGVDGECEQLDDFVVGSYFDEFGGVAVIVEVGGAEQDIVV